MRDDRSTTEGRVVDDGGAFDFAVLRDYAGFVLKSALRHKVLFLACFAAVVAGATGLALVVPSRYRVEATLLVQQGSALGALTNPSLSRDWDAPTRTELLRRDNLISVARRTDFVRRHLESRSPISRARSWAYAKLYRTPPDAEEELRSIVDGIERRLWVTPGGDGTIGVGFIWSDPVLTYDFVEAMVQGFLESRHAAITTQVNETIAILKAHDAETQREALALAAQLDEKMRAQRGRAAPRRVAPTILPTTPGQDEDHAELQARLAARREAVAQLEDLRRRRLDELQARYNALLQVFAPEHPQVLELSNQIESLSRPSPQLDQLRAEVHDLERTMKRVSPARAITPSLLPPGPLDLTSLASLDDHRLDYERTQLASLLRQHASLLERIETARMELVTAEANFKYRYSVVYPPQMPRGPLKPYPLIVFVAGILGGIAFAFFGTTMADVRRARVLERWQIERGLGITVIGEVRR